jgi:hypothetical protein
VNPEAKVRGQIGRSNLVANLKKCIAGSDDWPEQRRDKLVGELRSTPGLARLLRRTEDRKRIDRAAIAADAHQGGKWLIIGASDDTLSSTDLATA